MVVNGFIIHFNSEQRNFMEKFFLITHDFIENEDMLNPDNIGKYADIYQKYLFNSELYDDNLLKLFLVELKDRQLKEKVSSKNLSPKEKMKRMSVPAYSCQTRCKNGIINKWRGECNVVKVVTRSDIVQLNSSLDSINKQNAKERRLSWGDVDLCQVLGHFFLHNLIS